MEPKWLAQAKALPYGRKRKIVCCGDTPSMIINHGVKGYSAHCFRDDAHGGFVPHGQLSLSELAARHAASTELLSGPIKLPHDFTTVIPDRSRLWLLRASVSSFVSGHYGFGYSPLSDRVILPVRRGDDLVAFVARATEKVRPKYLAKYKDGTNSAIFLADPAIAVRDRLDVSDLVVLTEDILSCVRVGRIAPTAAILGTSIEGLEEDLWRAFELCDHPTFVLWFDGDAAGRKARDRIGRRLALRGARVVKVTTELDPKKYSNREIKEILLDRLSTAALDEVPQGLQPSVGSAAQGKQDG